MKIYVLAICFIMTNMCHAEKQQSENTIQKIIEVCRNKIIETMDVDVQIDANSLMLQISPSGYYSAGFAAGTKGRADYHDPNSSSMMTCILNPNIEIIWLFSYRLDRTYIELPVNFDKKLIEAPGSQYLLFPKNNNKFVFLESYVFATTEDEARKQDKMLEEKYRKRYEVKKIK
ncbi:MAG: hypothetical protein HRU24_15550 [Gammaproteobacteria bacterium]|nr:hypothetical protein [Gammaproteobacteria bacterium]